MTEPIEAAASEALRLLAAEDERQSKLHELLETIREQIRLEVPPEHRPEGLFNNIQNAVYAMRGRTPLMNDAAITGAFCRPETYPEGITTADHIAHDMKQGRFPRRSTVEEFLSERRAASDDRQQTAAFQSTDDADPSLVLAAVRHCASSWEGDARLLGNVRAKDIVRAIDTLRRPAASGDLRERIATKIQTILADRLSIDALNFEIDGCGPASYAIADAILASLPGRDEEAIRAEERERCEVPPGFILLPIEPTAMMALRGFQQSGVFDPDDYFGDYIDNDELPKELAPQHRFDDDERGWMLAAAAYRGAVKGYQETLRRLATDPNDRIAIDWNKPMANPAVAKTESES